MTDSRDLAAATELVDYALDYVKASANYREWHRHKAIREEIPFARFERRQRERAKAAIARARGED